MKKYFFSLLFAGLFSSSIAQVEVTQEPIIPYFLDQVVGDATVVSGVQVNGVDFDVLLLQAGTFTDPSASMGLTSGIILGTGDVMLAESPNTSSSSSLPGAQTQYSDPDLESLSPFSVNDQIVLEFDFVAIGNEVWSNYVFASEEYPEYVCGTVNDVIGVFISGPNPDGGEYVNENVALIPNPTMPDEYTGTPVSINTLNPGVPGANGQPDNCDEADPNWSSYSVFYVENTTNTYEYDGRTQVLQVRWPVVPGELYHMKMGTGDGGDTVFDSAFLLQANSFRTTAPPPNGIEELISNAFTIYPNPASDFLVISASDESITQAVVQITDMQGKQVFSNSWTSSQSRVDISDLSEGVYILSVSTAEGLVSQELLTIE